MTEKEKAEQLIHEFRMILMNEDTECGNEILCTLIAVKCARIAVKNILASNPHTNPFNTELQSTFNWWYEVYNILNQDL